MLDAIALRRPRAADVQSMRAERHAVRSADVAIGFSPRVARVIGIRQLCPVTLPVPAEPVAPVADPVALMIADWAWRPNQQALQRMLLAWPAVRAEVPAATLLLAGRGMTDPPRAAGVEVVGPVPQARDVLARAAVLAFPCPPTSGPKMKVLDALAHGVPVVTTPAGVEGLSGVQSAVAVASERSFASALAAVLSDPQRRVAMARAGREAVLAHHTPQQAAAARLALCSAI